ncbi:mucin-5B-like isoform X2 [Pseudophryne corroboree]|uniref:mucin-5B-like isoform X2 n=1 Tax=Pseudophryne corroboree TaxID=495146 RepID=UPI00308160CB
MQKPKRCNTKTVTTFKTPCTAPCQWTQWFNVDHPTDQPDGGDWETLDNIRAHGYNVCKTPKEIDCRSVQYPYIPFAQLMNKVQCDVHTGLVCTNKDNVVNCVDFQIKLLCCHCDQEPDAPGSVTTLTSTVPTANHCKNPHCTWTQWFNTHQPTTGPGGGDFENIHMIMESGYSVCDVPSAIQCRLSRFPYIPLEELYYMQVCSVSIGLNCLNKNNPAPCLDYEVQYLCCNCDVHNMTSTMVPTAGLMQTTTKANVEETTQEKEHNAYSPAEMTDTPSILTLEPGSGSGSGSGMGNN